MTDQEARDYYNQACQPQTFSPAPPPGYCDVHTVAEPSSLWLVLAGIAMLWWTRRRRK